jgi:hypothetical protein
VAGEPAPDLTGVAERPPGAAAVAAAVPVDVLLGVRADQRPELRAVGRVEQRDGETVGAVRGVRQPGQP